MGPNVHPSSWSVFREVREKLMFTSISRTTRGTRDLSCKGESKSPSDVQFASPDHLNDPNVDYIVRLLRNALYLLERDFEHSCTVLMSNSDYSKQVQVQRK